MTERMHTNQTSTEGGVVAGLAMVEPAVRTVDDDFDPFGLVVESEIPERQDEAYEWRHDARISDDEVDVIILDLIEEGHSTREAIYDNSKLSSDQISNSLFRLVLEQGFLRRTQIGWYDRNMDIRRYSYHIIDLRNQGR